MRSAALAAFRRGATSLPGAYLDAAAPTRALCFSASSFQNTSSNNAQRESNWGRYNWAGAVSAGAGLGLGSASLLAQADAPQPPSPPAGSDQVSADPYKRPTALQGLPKDITLYQYEVCPFCCKVKAALDYYKLPYEVIEVNPLTKSELKWSNYKKVPVVKMDGSVVVDSTVIMSRLAAEYEAAQSGNSSKPQRSKAPVSSEEEEEQWRRWVDDRLVKVITANIYRSWDESWNTFRYVTEQTNWAWGLREAARVSGAVLMWQVGKKMPAKYGIQGDLREVLYQECNKLVDAMQGAPFLGGTSPNLGDLSAFGVLRAVQHTPTFEDAMANSKVKPWFERMEQQVGPSQRVERAAPAS
ncbi:glutathione S-transferase [Dunaliella salina]|uniref:Prostaglandin E synthase 2 n=1 Tax=Dunaliella salina TaxID=3046 RepID=A0ABQ7GRJ5_DUNSA|nr:glutathione S-transferase [Dunaliella salina]|eukprot:KAF5837234.1 glutathione S-transferase [Dunaliella salina]